MKRRVFIVSIASAFAWPYAIRAQSSTKRPLIAFLTVVPQERNALPLGAFLKGLRELDYVEGRDFDFAYRSSEGYSDRLSALAEEVVRLKPSVVLAAVTAAAVAARALTETVPIVCPLLADPVRFGLIASESRPSGNVTGLLFRTEGLAGKQLELARELIPDASRVGFVVNVASGVIIDRQELESASRRLGMALVPAEVRTSDDLDTAFRALADDHVAAVIVLVDGMFFSERRRIAALAAATRLPTIYGVRPHVDAGGLISYGVNAAENFHRAAAYVVKILKGAKPSDLPVEFPTKLELIVNVKTATALGITIPPSIMIRADEVIE
jgi:putative tryptophan/tyrosine transport system substrate-binding protein